jgi:hypothetical protein
LSYQNERNELVGATTELGGLNNQTTISRDTKQFTVGLDKKSDFFNALIDLGLEPNFQEDTVNKTITFTVNLEDNDDAVARLNGMFLGSESAEKKNTLVYGA